MRNQLKIIYGATISLVLISLVSLAQKRHFGNYINKWRYWGPMFILKSDSTFDYILRTNAGTVTKMNQTEHGTVTTTTDSYIFSDSSYGRYKIINDTVFLSYATEEVEGEFNGHNRRPAKLYWEGKSLYYIHPQTGFVLRQKEYYMTRSKRKTSNLSKAEEKFSQREKFD